MPTSGPITVIADTREQTPWVFDPSRFETVRETLQTGDYTVKGFKATLRVERKSLGDFVGSVIHDWLRFRKKLVRLAFFDIACVVVEADISDVYAHRYESDANPASVLGKANAIYLDHGVPVFWWGPRSHCVPMVERFFRLLVNRTDLEGVP